MGLIISLIICLIFFLIALPLYKIFFKKNIKSGLAMTIYVFILFLSIVLAMFLSARVLIVVGGDAEFVGTGFAYMFGGFLCLVALVVQVAFLMKRYFFKNTCRK